MIIKKFQAATEEEAIRLAQAEMGNNAIIMHIKTIKHRALARLFKKDTVEVTAALEEKTDRVPVKKVNEIVSQDTKPLLELEKNTNAIEEKLDNLQSMIENKINTALPTSEEEKDVTAEVKENNNVNFTISK